MKSVALNGTTDAAGDLTTTSTIPITGWVEKVELNFGTWAANMDITINIIGSTTQAIFVKANQGAADAVWYPRVNVVDGADAAAFAAENSGKYYLNGEKLQLVLADGGNAKTGEIIVHLSDSG